MTHRYRGAPVREFKSFAEGIVVVSDELRACVGYKTTRRFWVGDVKYIVSKTSNDCNMSYTYHLKGESPDKWWPLP